MSHEIRSIMVRSLRGATTPFELVFDPSHKLTVIYGENGTGKSTIVDAIDLVCNGNLGSIIYRKLGKGQRKEQFVRSLGAGVAAAEVRHGGVASTAKMQKTTLERHPAEGCPTAKILRRSELLDFVDSDPAERYKRVAAFISFPGVARAEKSLREAAATASSEFDEAARARSQAHDELKKYWGLEGRPGTDYLVWARAEAARPNAAVAADAEAARSELRLAEGVDAALSAVEAAEDKESAACERNEIAAARLRDVSGSLSAGSEELAAVLEAAKRYFTGRTGDTECPVCERGGIRAEALFTRIDERLLAFRELSLASGDANKAAAELSRATNLLTKANTQLQEKINAAPDLREATAHLPARQAAESIRAKKPTLAAREAAASARLAKDNAIRQHASTIEEKEQALQEAAGESRRLAQILAVFEKTRKAFVDAVLDEISAKVNELFSALHPGEALGSIRLLLDPTLQGSLKFESDFQNQGPVQPQAYFSESHLDTLGICVFLALAEREVGDNTVVVLDDVFTSVDHEHLDRVVDLLHHEATRFAHVVITTHYQPWLKRYLHGRASAPAAQLLRLRPWSFASGMRVATAKLAIDELQASLDKADPDPQAIASKAGIGFENILDHLTDLYECPLPKRPNGRYTLGEMLSSLGGKLQKALGVRRHADHKVADSALGPLLDALAAVTWVRNDEGCHLALDETVSEAEVRSFGEKVVRLARELTCACGEMPHREKSGEFWSCRCGQLELRPLVRP